MAAKQGSKTVSEYAHQLKSLWQELGHYRVILLNGIKSMIFLLVQNPSLIKLGSKSSGSRKFRVLIKWWILFNNEKESDTSTPKSIHFSMIAEKIKLGSIIIERKVAMQNGKRSKAKCRDGLWCTHCKKAHHTRETCWTLHGKPPRREWGQKGDRLKSNGQAHAATNTLTKKLRKRQQILIHKRLRG